MIQLSCFMCLGLLPNGFIRCRTNEVESTIRKEFAKRTDRIEVYDPITDQTFEVLDGSEGAHVQDMILKSRTACVSA